MWPKESLYTKSSSRKDCYDSETREFAESATFGKARHSRTLKNILKEYEESDRYSGGRRIRHPPLSTSVYDRTALNSERISGNNKGANNNNNTMNSRENDNENGDEEKNENENETEDTSSNDGKHLISSIRLKSIRNLKAPNSLDEICNKSDCIPSTSETLELVVHKHARKQNRIIEDEYERQKNLLMKRGQNLLKHSRYPLKVRKNYSKDKSRPGVSREGDFSDDEEHFDTDEQLAFLDGVRYKKGNWSYMANDEIKPFKPLTRILPNFGMDVRHEFTNKNQTQNSYDKQNTAIEVNKNNFLFDRKTNFYSKDGNTLYHNIFDAKYENKSKFQNEISKHDDDTNEVVLSKSKYLNTTVSYSDAILEKLMANNLIKGQKSRNPFRPNRPVEVRIIPSKSNLGFSVKSLIADHPDRCYGNFTNYNNGEYSNMYEKNNQFSEIRKYDSILDSKRSSTVYRETLTRTPKLRTYSVLISADDSHTNSFQRTKIPSKEEISKSLTAALKMNSLAYRMRITETAVLVKALKDPRHKTPGVAAIVDLHKCFLAATSTNPNAWVLSRDQVVSVLRSRIPWYPTESANRLFSTFDPERNGKIRYIRLTCTVLLSSPPVMSFLTELQNKAALLKIDGKNNTHSLVEGNPAEFHLLKIIFNFYETCEGSNEKIELFSLAGSQKNLPEMAEGPSSHTGLRLEHVTECLSHCSASAEDKNRMTDILPELLQRLYIRMKPSKRTQNESKTEIANPELQFSKVSESRYLNSVKFIPRISQDDLFRGLEELPHIFEEYNEQIKRFRILSAAAITV